MLASLFIRRVWELSNAFDKSGTAAWTLCFLYTELRISWRVADICVSHDSPVLSPCCPLCNPPSIFSRFRNDMRQTSCMPCWIGYRSAHSRDKKMLLDHMSCLTPYHTILCAVWVCSPSGACFIQAAACRDGFQHAFSCFFFKYFLAFPFCLCRSARWCDLWFFSSYCTVFFVFLPICD